MGESDSPGKIHPHIANLLVAQKRRRRAFEEGVYELDNDEGYHCENCDWRGLDAPAADDFGLEGDFVKCPECDTPGLTTFGTSDKYLESFSPGPLPDY